MLHEETRKRVESGYGAVAVFGDRGLRIEVREQETASGSAFCCGHIRRKSGQSLRLTANVFDRFDTAIFSCRRRVFSIRSVARRSRTCFSASLNFSLLPSVRVAAVHVRIGRVEDGNFRAQQIEIDQVRLEAVVKIGGVVGDFVHQIDQLRFERRALIEKIFGELREIPRRNNRANA